MSRVLLTAHGTRFAPGREAVDGLRSALQQRLGGREVVLGWVDVCEPRAADVVRDGDVMVPAFLGDGFHVRHDVPAAAAAARDVVVTPHLGAHPRLLDALDARVREAGGPWPVTLLAWAGSRNPTSRVATEAVASTMASRWGVDVRIVTPARLDEVLAGLGEHGDHDGGGATITPPPRVGMASWLLAPGLFSERFAATGLPCSDPLGSHPIVIEALADLVEAAGRGGAPHHA